MPGMMALCSELPVGALDRWNKAPPALMRIDSIGVMFDEIRR
jgi:hypothetical protein